MVSNSLKTYESMFKPCKAFETYLQQGERYKLYDAVQNKTIAHETQLAGLYSPTNDIYCLWNRTQYKQNESELHEYCHHLIEKEDCWEDEELISCKRHFCG
jgi:hypothetical protein